MPPDRTGEGILRHRHPARRRKQFLSRPLDQVITDAGDGGEKNDKKQRD